ncbi:ADP-ribosylglycohydrolase family protein [Streptomyces sp. NPDC087440]|uniref:ADP-ribosylglycohydrolase family protein n=1 Tax=Streptomyces sp. NPDC087440 TaxID=3365790 RepID=UPI0037FD0FE2
MNGPLRLTWVQPEDLVGHELRQAEEDGRDPSSVRSIRTRWLAAGGHLAPDRAGASPTVPPPTLRTLAESLLDELATLPTPLRGAGNCAPSHNTPAQTPPQPLRVSGSMGSPLLERSRELGEGEGQAPQATATTPHPPQEPAPTPTSYPTRLHHAWLGRATGCLLGKPVEKLPLPAIRTLAQAAGNWPLTTYFTAVGVPDALLRAHPWNKRSAPTSLAENIDGMPEDDDLNYALLNLLLLQRHTRDFTTHDVARLWLDELPAGRTFTAERIAYRNLLDGIEPPHTATHRNPFREWIGASIRADMHGWTNPGDPTAAADQAHRDATLTHTGNGVYGAMFVAAAIAEAATGTVDIHHALRTGLAHVPPRSRLADAVRLGIDTAERHDDFDAAVDHLHAALGHHHWVHVLPNTALLAAALTHADGDFTHSICRAVSGGWDTDSNGATAGSLAALVSPTPVPTRWTAPLHNRLATSLPHLDGIGFDTLARLTHREATR